MTNSISGSPLLDTDTLIVNRDGVDYHTTRREVHPPICDFEELPVPPKPWEGHNGVIWHVKNATETVYLREGPPMEATLCQGYDANTLADLGMISEIKVGEDIVFLTDERPQALFDGNKTANWDFGEYTDISKAKIFQFLFMECHSFNGKLGGNWDTSNVTYMANMFNEAKAFNQDISGWDVSNVTNFFRAFYKADTFNIDIGNWDVGEVTDMYEMFSYAFTFNQDISGWNVSSARKMDRMVFEATAFNQDLTGWCVNPEPAHYGFSSESGMPKDLSYDPVWGTCP